MGKEVLYFGVNSNITLKIQNPFQRLSFRFSRVRMPRSLWFKVVSVSISFSFIWAFLCIVDASKALLKDDTRWRGLQTKRSFWIKIDKTKTDMGICFTIFFVVPFSSYVTYLAQEQIEIINCQVLAEF